MRWEKAWIIARKEFSEYRRNKYIIYSLVVMPIVLGIVMPMIYLLPVSMVGHSSQQPLDLHLNVTQELSNTTLQDTSGQDLRLVNVTLIGSSFYGCELIDCQVRNSVLTNCSFNRYSISYSAVNSCNIYNTSVDGTVILTNSVVIGQEGAAEQLFSLLINILLIFFALMPTVIPTVIASYSIVGEKVNRSLEPLLATPLSDEELLAGKALSIFLPSVLVVWAVFIPFSAIVDFIAAPALGYVPAAERSVADGGLPAGAGDIAVGHPVQHHDLGAHQRHTQCAADRRIGGPAHRRLPAGRHPGRDPAHAAEHGLVHRGGGRG